MGFEIGEIVIGQNFINWPERNGMECEIIGELKERGSSSLTTGIYTVDECYEVKWEDGITSAQKPYFLRKKKPPEIDWVEMLDLKMPQREMV